MKGETLILFDVDNSLFGGPPPIHTGWSLLLKGKLELPLPDRELKPGKECDPFTYWNHSKRSLRRDAANGLALLGASVGHAKGRVKLGILSGRGPGLHDLTRRQIDESGFGWLFDPNHIYLSNVDSSGGFKEQTGKEKVEEGYSVVLVEDDIKSAMMFSRVSRLCRDGQVVWSYLLANISNSDFMLRNTTLPKNVTRVPSFHAAAIDISRRIQQGSI